METRDNETMIVLKIVSDGRKDGQCGAKEKEVEERTNCGAGKKEVKLGSKGGGKKIRIRGMEKGNKRREHDQVNV